MQVLIAEDEAVSSQVLEAVLRAQGHEVTATADGAEAWGTWQISQPRVVISDWLMPEMDGLELCRRIRSRRQERYTYFILLTARSGKQNYLAAMDAEVDDFLTKPVDPDELSARLRVAERILGLREELHILEGLLQVKQLHGLLPICSYCKSIRRDDNYWQQVEHYIAAHSDAQFSHGICPDCYTRYIQPQIDRLP